MTIIDQLRSHTLGDMTAVLAGAHQWATLLPDLDSGEQAMVEISYRDRTEGTFEVAGPMPRWEASCWVERVNSTALRSAHATGTVDDDDRVGAWAVETVGGRIVKAEHHPTHSEAVAAATSMASAYGARYVGALQTID